MATESKICTDIAATQYNLGIALKRARRLKESAQAFGRAIELQPDFPEALNNLGNVWRELRLPDDAARAYRQALRLRPQFSAALNNLGLALKDIGEIPDALECFDRALVIDPGNPAIAGNRMSTLLLHESADAEMILHEHQRWNALFAEPLAAENKPHENDPAPDRRLRIGYVSADFREHPIGRFIAPLLGNHHHAKFEVFCYSSVPAPDFLTHRLRGFADVWREVAKLSDAALAELIRQDRIDILIDLTMHLAGNRLLTFARKPAPVQVTYLAYCGTTGVRAIDYRFTDRYLDPPGEDQFYSEKSVRLETFWCYEAPSLDIPIAPAPVLSAGHITFGCLNNFCKVSPGALDAWARIMQAVADSRLILHAPEGTLRTRVGEWFGQRGIESSRVEFTPLLPFEEYLKQYHRIDIALDPFPHGGGTTSCDALWMAVPLITLRGRTAVGRGGASVLCHVGLGDLIANSADEYVKIATNLAHDISRLSSLRAALRPQMSASPLMNAPRFAVSVESTYRAMWQEALRSNSF